MQVKQGTKHPEAGPWHKFSQMFTVVIGYPGTYQIRVIKLIRGSNIFDVNNSLIVAKAVYCFANFTQIK